MKRGVRVKVDYRRYGADATVSEWKLDPYFVKLFNKRWYALVKFPDPNANLFTLAFDRIISLEVTEDKSFYREKYGLPQDQFVVMVAAGGYGRSGMSRVVNALVHHVKHPVTIVAICGTNTRLYRRLERLKGRTPKHVDLRPYEFVNKVYELNRAADVLLTKGGPNAMLDSALMEVPIGVFYYASEIEHISTHLFTDVQNCGRFFRRAQRIVRWINECITDPSILDIYKDAERDIRAAGNGAVNIARFIQTYE